MQKKQQNIDPNEMTIMDYYEKQTKERGREVAVERIEKYTGYMLPASTWNTGYQNGNFISDICRRSVIILQSQFMAPLSLDFRLIGIKKEVAAVILEKQCEDLGLNMKKITGFEVLDPPDLEYVFHISLFIAAMTGKRTKLLDDIIAQVFGLRIAPQAMGALLATNVTRNRGGLFADEDENAPRTTAPRAMLLSEESRRAIEDANAILNIKKTQQQIQALNRNIEGMAGDILLNPNLRRRVQDMGIKKEFDSARRRVLERANRDSLALSVPAQPQGDNRINIVFVNACNALTLRSFIQRLIKLKFTSEAFNQHLWHILEEAEDRTVHDMINQMHTSFQDAQVDLTHVAIERRLALEDNKVLLEETTFAQQLQGLMTTMTYLRLCDFPPTERPPEIMARFVVRGDRVISESEAQQRDSTEKADLFYQVINARRQRAHREPPGPAQPGQVPQQHLHRQAPEHGAQAAQFAEPPRQQVIPLGPAPPNPFANPNAAPRAQGLEIEDIGLQAQLNLPGVNPQVNAMEEDIERIIANDNDALQNNQRENNPE